MAYDSAKRVIVTARTHDTAMCSPLGAIDNSEFYGAGTMADGTTRISTRNTATTDGSSFWSMEANISLDMAVLNRAVFEHTSRDTTCPISRCNACVGNVNILHLRAISDIPEETVIIQTGIVNADAADGVSLAIEVAAKVMRITDGSVVVLRTRDVVPGGFVRVGNVGTQLEEYA